MRWSRASVYVLGMLISRLATAESANDSFSANYPEVLQKSLYFFEAQRAGPLAPDNRVRWRADAAANDGRAEGVDLTGGWFDAGDHVKFGFPAAASATLLAWSLLETPEGYSEFHQDKYALDNLRWINDFFMRAHSAPNELWVQVGNGSADHAYWGAAETMSMPRPAYKITATCPGSDVAAETAASMAAASLVFRAKDPGYADRLADHAKSLYKFAEDYPGEYSSCVRDAEGYYRSSGYKDELMWGALWLYQLTGESAYLTKAETLFDGFRQNNEFPYQWTHAWDDKVYGSYILLSRLSNNPIYEQVTERWLDYWTVGAGGARVTYTPGGLAWASPWGALRYAANTSMLAFFYSEDLRKRGETMKAARYHQFAKKQIDYMLGDNPRGQSYVVGYGYKSPKNPHHRGAHGSWSNNIDKPLVSRHILYGALVGGPDANDAYIDDRKDFVRNEVATDYNAGFTGALAFLAARYGGTIQFDFPPVEKPDEEFFVTAKVNAEGRDFFEFALKVHNHTAFPARVTRDVKVHYYFNLSEISDHAQIYNNIKVSTNYNQGAQVSGVKPIDLRRGLYFVECDFSKAGLAPTSDSDSQKEVQVRLSLPRFDDRWQSENDWSFEGIGRFEFAKTEAVTVFENGRLVWGKAPVPQSTNP